MRWSRKLKNAGCDHMFGILKAVVRLSVAEIQEDKNSKILSEASLISEGHSVWKCVLQHSLLALGMHCVH